MRKIPFRDPDVWVIAVFIAGICYLISLQLLLADGVYFSGDSGLKAMIAQNLADGYLAFDLNLPDPPWITGFWKMGMFPYDPPFVYEIEGKYFTQYPFPFPLVTAPFYALFGYYGLYVVPWAATIGIWLIFIWLCKRFDVSPAAIVIGLFCLIFTTHLSFYSATYWEHTLSVCLAFGGIGLIIPNRGVERLSVRAAAAAGVLSSLAVWFRPEQIFVVVFLVGLALWSYGRAAWKLGVMQKINLGRLPDHIGRTGLVAFAASLVTLLLYGFFNWLIYKNIFGVHAIQVLEYIPLRERVTIFFDNFQAMTVGRYAFFTAVPITFFVIGYLLILLVRREVTKQTADWFLWAGFSAAFIVGVALLVPESAGGKQWGPRFLLMLVPIIALVFTLQLDHLLKNPPAAILRWIAAMTVLILAVMGIIQNPIRGREYFITNNAPTQQVVNALRAETPGTIGISNPYLTQLFQPAVSRAVNFVLIPDDYELAFFSKVLLEQNQDSFRFLCYSYSCEFFDPTLPSREVFFDEGYSYTLHILKTRDYDRFRIFDIRIEKME